MSKKTVAPATSIAEKVPRFAGWICFFGAVIEFIVIILDYQHLFTRESLSLLIFLIVNAGTCYALSIMTEKNPGNKKAIFKDWLISSLIINIVMIGSVAAYIGVE
ncbi:MAG: hypothetical protein RBG13Loki_3157 [Promethearchaeota archaeon CR_4]|nr:MAG: hypothetical protein RBG13Loki_3157 [Candidatus Lokiarchaeota archaeon CR_4]